MINDAHCHFFSARFFETLGSQMTPRPSEDPAVSIPESLGWDPPGQAETLADRWVTELDSHGVTRAAIMASVPGDEASVSTAVHRHPDRFVGMAMLNPTVSGATARIKRALEADELRCVCLFPAMHGYELTHESVEPVFSAAAGAGGAVFIHCGVLTVGVRRKLRLATQVNLRAGDPLALTSLATQYPSVPIVIPHFGAGFLMESLIAADLCPNIYLDTSSSNSWLKYHPGLTLTQVFQQVLETLGPERLLFGSDSSFFPRGWQRTVLETQLSILDALKITPTARHAILAENFDRIFGCSTVSHSTHTA